MAEGGNINKNASSSVVDWSVIPNCKSEEELQGLEYEDNLKEATFRGHGCSGNLAAILI